MWLGCLFVAAYKMNWKDTFNICGGLFLPVLQDLNVGRIGLELYSGKKLN